MITLPLRPILGFNKMRFTLKNVLVRSVEHKDGLPVSIETAKVPRRRNDGSLHQGTQSAPAYRGRMRLTIDGTHAKIAKGVHEQTVRHINGRHVWSPTVARIMKQIDASQEKAIA